MKNASQTSSNGKNIQEYLSVKLISATSATKYQVSRFYWFFCCFFFFLCLREMKWFCMCVCAFVLLQNHTKAKLCCNRTGGDAVREPWNRKIDNENNKEPTIVTISTHTYTKKYRERMSGAQCAWSPEQIYLK